MRGLIIDYFKHAYSTFIGQNVGVDDQTVWNLEQAARLQLRKARRLALEGLIEPELYSIELQPLKFEIRAAGITNQPEKLRNLVQDITDITRYLAFESAKKRRYAQN